MSVAGLLASQPSYAASFWVMASQSRSAIEERAPAPSTGATVARAKSPILASQAGLSPSPRGSGRPGSMRASGNRASSSERADSSTCASAARLSCDGFSASAAPGSSEARRQRAK